MGSGGCARSQRMMYACVNLSGLPVLVIERKQADGGALISNNMQVQAALSDLKMIHSHLYLPVGVLIGGGGSHVTCRMSNLRNANIACFGCLFFPILHVDFKKTHVICCYVIKPMLYVTKAHMLPCQIFLKSHFAMSILGVNAPTCILGSRIRFILTDSYFSSIITRLTRTAPYGPRP